MNPIFQNDVASVRRVEIGSRPFLDVVFKGKPLSGSNPYKLDNFLGPVESDDLRRAIDFVNADRDADVARLSSVGDNFCSGGDVNFFLKCIEDGDVHLAADYMRGLHRLCRTIQDSPKKIIVDVQGAAFGLGSEIACSGSKIIARKNMALAIPQLRMGLVMLSGYRLAQKIGPGLALYLQLMTLPTPKGFKVSAEDGLAMGLVDAVLDPGLELTEDLLTSLFPEEGAHSHPSHLTNLRDEFWSSIDKNLKPDAVRARLLRGGIEETVEDAMLANVIRKLPNPNALDLANRLLTKDAPQAIEDATLSLLSHPNVFGALRKKPKV